MATKDALRPDSRTVTWLRTQHKNKVAWLPTHDLQGEVLIIELHKRYRCVHPKGVVFRTTPTFEVRSYFVVADPMLPALDGSQPRHTPMSQGARAKKGIRTGKTVECSRRVDEQWMQVDQDEAEPLFLPLYNESDGLLFEGIDEQAAQSSVTQAGQQSEDKAPAAPPTKTKRVPEQAPAPVILEERRIDPSDGGAYTQGEFDAFYGDNCAEWHVAIRIATNQPNNADSPRDKAGTDASAGTKKKKRKRRKCVVCIARC